jgi:hypothetical protein
MSPQGWERLLEGWPWFRGEGSYPVLPYSEFMPPAYLVRKPYGTFDEHLPSRDDPWGWPVSEYEEALLLRPGLERIAHEVAGNLLRFARGESDHLIHDHALAGNPYWPPRLAERAGSLHHERHVTLLPLALSRTKDYQGRLRWTLFGASEQGPAKAFWRSFFTAPGREWPPDQALAFLRRLLAAAYGESDGRLGDLRAAGFRILPQGGELPLPYWDEGPLPGWTAPFLMDEDAGAAGVKYLLTFRPFARLPAAAQRAYLAGELHLIPFPGSLIFWGAPGYLKLQRELPLAVQVLLLMLTERFDGPFSVRTPQSGWMAEPLPDGSMPSGHRKKIRDTYHRIHRHMRVRRDEDPLTAAHEHRLTHALFGTAPHDLGLYGKPAARNVQLWDEHFHLLLDGPAASHEDICRAADAVAGGGWFGYRFQYPPMRLGPHELYWHRPLVTYLHPGHGRPVLLPDAPTGYLTAYPAGEPDLAHPVELWPRLLRRDCHAANVQLFGSLQEDRPHQTLLNVLKLLEAREALGGVPLPRSLARQLVTLPRGGTLDSWLDGLPRRSTDPARAHGLADDLRRGLADNAPAGKADLPPTLTFERTARRSFEVAYWKLLAEMSSGAYAHKNNADPCLDRATRAALPGERRDLDVLGDYLLAYHARSVAEAGMTGKALVGELPFRWRTEYAYPWMGGWLANHHGQAHERNLVAIIPGRDRGRAVLFADHYDTAYMEDVYERRRGGDGARVAAPGADDNCSATATLLLAAPVFLALSKAGKLGCDVWLVHLTGEEFPAEGLGANQVAQCLVEGNLRIRLAGGEEHDLSGVRVQGLYVMDMIGHNSNSGRDVFQIAPGASRESLWLAYQAHRAAEAWNAWSAVWNRKAARRGRGRGRRSRDAGTVPATARHPRLSGEVRPPADPRSTLYNTDGQVLSDAGVPVVLFMENYDIDRSGYHDTKDTMANINLDYAAALAAICIEATARAATEEPPRPGA